MVKKIEVLKVEVEIIKSKLLAFLAVYSGSWIYAFKIDNSAFTTVLFISFIVASYGVFSNMLKLSDLHKELKGLK